MKKIPKVFQNSINKKIDNNETYFVGNKEVKYDKPIDISKKINDIFKSTNYIYRINTSIKLKNGEVVKKIIGKKNNHLITIDNEYIPISIIRDIYK